jgi:hypothetical protein
MELIYHNGKWVFRGGYEDRQVPKDARFRWSKELLRRVEKAAIAGSRICPQKLNNFSSVRAPVYGPGPDGGNGGGIWKRS